MNILGHELKQGKLSLSIWTASITFLFVICIFMYPEMKHEMEDVSDIFASMGGFSEAFGMDKLGFGEFIGFYSVECGNILGLGGAIFASITAITALAKEEKDHTAEFLLTHPVSRMRVVAEKLCSVILQVIVLNTAVFVISAICIAMIDEDVELKKIVLIHVANLIMQLELSAICFGISAFIRRGSLGIGLGMSMILYFLNIIANITEEAEWLNYITPFGYTQGADIVDSASLDMPLIALGCLYAAVALTAAFIKYTKKDIA